MFDIKEVIENNPELRIIMRIAFLMVYAWGIWFGSMLKEIDIKRERKTE
jgi:hypothetical protein